ncbi:MAG TPA: hypothetical protein VF430_08505 [Verrucomicrobiae bacterium]|jgi:hypothetical protein
MIRLELQPPRQDRKTIDRLTRLAEQIVAAVDSRADYRNLIAEFNTATHRSFTPSDFVGAAGSMTMREFTKGALMPEPHRLEGVKKDDLLEIIRQIRNEQKVVAMSESELGYYIQFLAVNIPNPRISDSLFHSDHLRTAEQVLEEAMCYRPFAMPAPKGFNSQCALTPRRSAFTLHPESEAIHD